MTINQDLLNTYFFTTWRQKNETIDRFQFSGFNLIDRIQLGERVLDIGCGLNQFTGNIPNLIGIDPAFPEADFQTTLEDYARSNTMIRFNAVFCLESINFGTSEDIERQIRLIVQLLRRKSQSRIYWRSSTHPFDDIEVYPWTFDEHIRLANLFNFEITEMEWDLNDTIFAEWVYRN
jgi:hypothetical protein